MAFRTIPPVGALPPPTTAIGIGGGDGREGEGGGGGTGDGAAVAKPCRWLPLFFLPLPTPPFPTPVGVALEACNRFPCGFGLFLSSAVAVADTTGGVVDATEEGLTLIVGGCSNIQFAGKVGGGGWEMGASVNPPAKSLFLSLFLNVVWECR